MVILLILTNLSIFCSKSDNSSEPCDSGDSGAYGILITVVVLRNTMVFCYLSDSGNFEKSGYVKDLGEFDGFSYSDASGDSEDLLHLVILVN